MNILQIIDSMWCMIAWGDTHQLISNKIVSYHNMYSMWSTLTDRNMQCHYHRVVHSAWSHCHLKWVIGVEGGKCSRSTSEMVMMIFLCNIRKKRSGDLSIKWVSFSMHMDFALIESVRRRLLQIINRFNGCKSDWGGGEDDDVWWFLFVQ